MNPGFMRRAVFILLAAMFCAGCATVRDVQQTIAKSFRSPGETMENSPLETAQYPYCLNQKQDMPVILETEVIPGRVSPGEEINHRLRYVQCLAVSPAEQQGSIVRSVSFGKKIVFEDKTAYEFKQGGWVLDAFIMTPAEAKPGVYTVNTTVIYKGISVNRSNSFQIKDAGPKP